MNPKPTRKRTFAFTYYPSDVDKDAQYFRDLCAKKCCKNMFIGLEECPTSNRLHFQGFVRFSSGKTWQAAKGKFFQLDKLHIEVAKASDTANRDYCLSLGKHEDKPGHIKRLIDFGEVALQGKRNDITSAIEILTNFGKMRDVLEEVHNYQACRHSELYLKYKEKPRAVPPPDYKVINIHGGAGSGKTKFCYNYCSPELPFRPVSYKWWEGYDAHPIILLDDIRCDFCKFHELLTLLDIYPFRVETKGGSREIQAKTIFITTPIPLVQMWSQRTAEDLKQLKRRITHTIHITEKEKLKSL